MVEQVYRASVVSRAQLNSKRCTNNYKCVAVTVLLQSITCCWTGGGGDRRCCSVCCFCWSLQCWICV